MDRNRILKSYYGFDTFKEGQAEVIDSIMAGRDVMCIMPTGAGKSVCYQIPALMQSGTTLVVSPLISLMKDQVSALSQMDIKAAYINSSMTSQEYGRTLSAMSRGLYRIVYVAPERLHSETFAEICREIDIPFIAVDRSPLHIAVGPGLQAELPTDRGIRQRTARQTGDRSLYSNSHPGRERRHKNTARAG